MIGRLKQIISESGYTGLIIRLFVRVLRERDMVLQLTRDIFWGSYIKRDADYTLASIIKVSDLDLLRNATQIPRKIIENYLDHRFDLLGSGWVKIVYGMSCRGLEQYRFDKGRSIHVDSKGLWLRGRINNSNLLNSQNIWQKVAPEYQPIDWQLDFKSGYRWSEKTWSKKIKFGNNPGVDVKVPWELARMQHLPQLALACFSSKLGEIDKYRIQNEFQNQTLDFISTNPPGFGVNWVCPMDVAIRAANWLLARDIFLASQIKFPEHFEKILLQSIYEHGLYIVGNLEWTSPRANHYLANIAGLAYIAAYLPSDEETDAWLAFSIQELIIEVERQFHEDGGNFEGSTAYHRLSAEMVYYATAVILGLTEKRLEKLISYNYKLFKHRKGKPFLYEAPMHLYPSLKDGKHSPFPMHYFQRMERMAEFIKDITKPNGSIPQIGDNDSGRFFKLEPTYLIMNVKEARNNYFNLDNYSDLYPDASYYMEDHLNCSHLVACGFSLFDRSDFSDWLGGVKSALSKVDTIILGALSRGRKADTLLNDSFTIRSAKKVLIGTADQFEKKLLQLQSIDNFRINKTEFFIETDGLLQSLTLHSYPDFGLFIFNSPRLFMVIRCWIGDVMAHSAHRHQDQLSLDLSIDGKNLISDPGTYLYTPLPSERNKYRDSNAHFSPFSNTNKAGSKQTTVFSPLRLPKIQITYWGISGFAAETTSKDDEQLFILLKNKSIHIYHVSKNKHKVDFLIERPPLFSSGYGIKHRKK